MRLISVGAVLIVLATNTVDAQFCGGADVGVPIPDNNSAGVTSTIHVPGPDFDITGIAAVVHVGDPVHSWVGDLRIRLTDPSGNTAELMNRPGVGPIGTIGIARNYGDDASGTGFRYMSRSGAHTFNGLNSWFPGCNATHASLAPYGGTGGSLPAATGGNIWSGAGVPGSPPPFGSSSSTNRSIPNGDYIASGNRFGSTYATSYVEVDLMSLLAPGPASGDWTIQISDHANGNPGGFLGWQLQLLPEPAACTVFALMAFALIRKRMN